MKLISLTLLGFEINSMIDSGNNFSLSFEQVHTSARDKKLASLIAATTKDPENLAILMSNGEEVRQVEAALSDAACALCGREQRKTGVQNNGLCLIMAIIFEAIQQQFYAH